MGRFRMDMVATVIRKELPDVDRRLAEMGLTRLKLLKVREVALYAAADVTPSYPANAWGTTAYMHGTNALREEFVGEHWKLDRPIGVEAISNEALKLKLVYANVDVACKEKPRPQPRSRKGGGAEIVCEPNLFGTLPEFAPKQRAGWSIYYLMVDEDAAVELSCPIIKSGRFTHLIERIWLSDGKDLERIARAEDGGDVAEGFDPEVARKK